MSCERARRALLERGLGTLVEEQRRELEGHLGACRECRAVAVAESRIDAELATLKHEVPERIDVVSRVMRIVTREAAPREVSDRQIAWGAAWTAMASGAILVAAVVFHPLVLRSMRFAGAMVDGLLALGALLVRPLLELAGALARAGYRIFVQIAPPETWSDLLHLLAGSAAVACCILMLAATAVVLARDIRRPEAAHPRGEG